MKVLSLFSGIGAFERALENLNIPHEIVNYCEIDKYAAKAYSLLHNVDESLNLQDVTKVDTSLLPQDIDLVTYGFPCQDISVAGQLKGLEHEGEQTRSGLVWDAHRIIRDTQPKVAICENVKNLVGKRFKKEFTAILESLEDMGYNNYWQVINAKDYGVPQNRERVFIVSIRKDIDKGSFAFPDAFPLEKRLKDVLEEEVPEKYYLSQKLLKYFIHNSKLQEEKGNGFRFSPLSIEDTAKAVTTKAGCRMDDNFVKVVGNYSPSCHEASRVLDPGGIAPTVKENHGTVNAVRLTNIYDEKFGTGYAGNVWNKEHIAPALMTAQGGNRQPLITVGEDSLSEKGVVYKVREATKQGYAEATEGDSINITQPSSTTRRGRVGKGVSNTLTTTDSMCVCEQYRIRKLTPSECFKLMGFTFEDVDLLRQNKISDTQLYKMAGNSIVVDVLMEIFKELYNEK